MRLATKLQQSFFEDIQQCPIGQLKIGRPYQRGIETTRLAKIYQSIVKHGFIPAYPVIVNQDFFVIDGQHRVRAAEQAGIKEVPVCVVSCDTIQKETALFVEFNSFNPRLSPIVLWYARYMAENPLAQLIHILNENEKSLFRNKVAEKGHASKSRFSIAEMLVIIAGAVFDSVQHWDQARDKFWCQQINKLALDAILQKINHFARWFFDCYGENKQYGILAYTDKGLRALVHFYVRLRRTGIFEEGIFYKEAVKKMKKFQFPPQWKTFSHAARMAVLVDYWNRKRRDYRIEFLPGEKEELID